MKIQYLSDVHLEFRGNPEDVVPPVAAPVLVLAGDIGNPRDPRYEIFLELCGKGRERVFLVSGNHCAYGSTVDETLALLRTMCASVRSAPTTLLERFQPHEHNGTIFMGDTLWSAIDESPDVWRRISDYRLIRGFTPQVSRGLHAVACADLSKAFCGLVEAGETRPAVVVTHHAPCREMNGKYAGNAIESAFWSDMREFCVSPVKIWISGHSHQSVQTTVGSGGVRSVSNCMGYPCEIETGYDPTAVVEV